MSFREKSAWVMAALMTLAGLFYLDLVVGASLRLGAPAPPVGIFVAYVVLVVIGSVVVQTALALSAPKEASAPADERERPLLQRAGNWSGTVLAVGAVGALLHYLQHGNGNLLFHTLLGSLIVSQIAEYVFQIALLRRAA
jgi:hypothetical protein